MANPWDNSTPVVGNIVRDVVPPELIALKQVNLDRARTCGNGFASGWNYTGFGGIKPILWASGFLNRGAYNPGNGEYTCDQTGFYRAEALIGYFTIPDLLNLDTYTLNIEKFTSGAWSTVTAMDSSTVGGSSKAMINLYAMGIFHLSAGDKIRYTLSVNWTSSATRTVIAAGATSAQAYIEFLRAP